jgi:hypothetical protein
MKVKNAERALVRAGFVRAPESKGSHQLWIDCSLAAGTDISFWTSGDEVTSAFRVFGRKPDRAEYDEFNSDYVTTLKRAIQLSRV